MKNCQKIMTREPFCCLPRDTVQKVAQLMERKDIGAVPIIYDKQSQMLAGIVTDRDLTLRVVAKGLDPEHTLVQEVMTNEVFSCGPEQGLDEALEVMEENHVRRLPIVDDGRIVGIIAQADIATRLYDSRMIAELVEEVSQSAVTTP